MFTICSSINIIIKSNNVYFFFNRRLLYFCLIIFSNIFICIITISIVIITFIIFKSNIVFFFTREFVFYYLTFFSNIICLNSIIIILYVCTIRLVKILHTYNFFNINVFLGHHITINIILFRNNFSTKF